MGADFTKWNDRYYGNGLQHILLLGDYLGNCLNSSPHGNLASWHLRHFLTYVFAVVGLFFMYLTGLLIWRDRLKALFPVILYLFHPRLFAESFYNIKDIGTLSGVMLGGYFIVRYALSPNKLNAFYLGIASAFVCSIRLVGLQFVLLGILIAVFMDFVCSRRLCCKHIFLQLLLNNNLLSLLGPAPCCKIKT